jgi:hypothetical protein
MYYARSKFVNLNHKRPIQGLILQPEIVAVEGSKEGFKSRPPPRGQF